MRTITLTRAHNLLHDPAQMKERVEAAKAAILDLSNQQGDMILIFADAVQLKENVQIALAFESVQMYEQALDFYTDVLRRLSRSQI